MALEEILRVPTAPSDAERANDVWDGNFCCNYSADGTKLLDTENFPEVVTVRPGTKVICDGAFAFDPYMAEDCRLGEDVPYEDRISFLEKIRLPHGLTHIGDRAFMECGGIDSIRLPKGLQYIGKQAFKDCCRLQYVRCPASLRVISESAFEGCISMYGAHLDIGLKVLGNRAFADCEDLVEINLPHGLEIIGKDIFKGCLNLEVIRIRGVAWPRFRRMLPKHLHDIIDIS